MTKMLSALLLLGLTTGSAWAASTPTTASPTAFSAPQPLAQSDRRGFVEAGGNFSGLNAGYGDWVGEYLKGEWQSSAANRWNGEFLRQREFGSSGVYGAIGDTYIFNPDWYGSLNVGASTEGAFFIPRYRIDAFLNRKWLPGRQLITTVGIGRYKAHDVHADTSYFFGATYYFDAPWIVQGGIRFNESNPGSVNSTSQFVAVTQGRDREHFLTLRFGFGEEAYQLVGPTTSISNFSSQQLSLELRQWIDRGPWGFTVRGEQYDSPNYDRTGINAGVFREF